MSELMIFENPKFGNIRAITENGRTLFCGSDVAKALGYDQPHKAIGRHCRYGTKRTIPHPQSPEKTIEMIFIPEGDIYRLAAKSELPGADEFESWIFDEVLPSIRKHGGYITGQDELTSEELMAKAVLVAQKTLAEREARIATLKEENQLMRPKAEYFDCLVDRNLLTNFRDTAKELKIKPKVFVSTLLDEGFLYRDQKDRLKPYQPHVDNGLFEIKESFSTKTEWKGTQTLVTPKGRETFRLLFCGTA